MAFRILLASPICVAVIGVLGTACRASADEPLDGRQTRILDSSNVVAWCIVPFDAAGRRPTERATMLRDLGITRSAYDWRAKHIPTFEDEIRAYKEHGIDFFAFWGEHDAAFDLFQEHDLHPQIWKTNPSPGRDSQQANVEAAAEMLSGLAQRTAELDCPLGLYNHGGWGGEPANLVAVCEKLRELGFKHVGIVYNFHHGHEHIAEWAELFGLMQPYLLCLNVNGMNSLPNPKILGLSKGEHELAMIRTVVKQGYRGPIGILDHRNELDARESLVENLSGLEWIRRELAAPGSGGAKPVTPKPIAADTRQ